MAATLTLLPPLDRSMRDYGLTEWQNGREGKRRKGEC